MRRISGLGVSLVLLLVTGVGLACGSDEPAGEVSFVQPEDGDSVVSPFEVKMVATGVNVEPASAGVNEGAGHHHIIINTDLPPAGSSIPSDDQYRHFGKGQTETVLDLPVGEHTLRLSFANGDHHPYDPAITDTVEITVTERRAVSFVAPVDGAKVKGPVAVQMSVEGLVVEPASEGVNEGAGHHHIVIDADLPVAGTAIPSDDQHRHFGKGQTEATLDLPPGVHTLRLSFADANHEPYDPPITDTVSITVEE